MCCSVVKTCFYNGGLNKHTIPLTYVRLPSITLAQLLHIDQVLALHGRAAGHVLCLRVQLVLVTFVLDGFRAAVRVAVVVKEAAEGELVECVFGVFSIAEPAIEGVIEIVLAFAAPQLLWVHGVKVGGVCRVGDGGDIGRHLLP